ncbi:MAG TPA: biotin/lipoyl-containing protein [Candidatus Bathyarchaeia archaeon]|nr:biotin/lipoyl-containing protein [Candidatus Bathyarchaeia archaeon]
MKREITVDGRRYEVEVTDCPIGSPFKVKVNDKSREVLLEHELNQKSFNLRIDKESYLIELPTLLRNTPFSVKVNNIPFKVEIKSSAPRITVASPHPVMMEIPKSTRTAVEGAVVAPMAGKIVSVKVRKGDQVKMGTILCVLEAMKMENEITAPKSGTVQEILVQAGKAVNEGDALVILK